jgi:hypothetical protein
VNINRPRVKLAAFAVAATATALASAAAIPAVAATAPASDARILIHWDATAGQRPENITKVPGGDFDVTLSEAAEVVQVTPQGQQSIVTSLPKPADGGVNTPVLHHELLTGIVRMPDGTLYLGYTTGTDALTGIWRVRPGGQPERIIALTAASFPNGMALDPRTGYIYVGDSTLGVIWRFNAYGPTPDLEKWVTGAALDPSQAIGVGVNGLKVHNGAVWISNSAQGTLVRIPIEPDGSAGAPQAKLTGGPFIDDFVFIGHSDNIIAAFSLLNEVALIRPDGSYSIVLDGSDGLQDPTSVLLEGETLYVDSAAYTLPNGDPSLLVAHFDTHGLTATTDR